MATLRQVQPVLSVRNVDDSARWYRDNLGFEPLFADDQVQPTYGGIGRDDVEIHLQSHSEREWDEGLRGSVYRFVVDDPDELFEELAARGDVLAAHAVDDTDWGTREFGLHDPDGNALFFYRDR